MSVFQSLGVQNDFQRGSEYRHITLRLPELDVEPVIGVADLSIGLMDYLFHGNPRWDALEPLKVVAITLLSPAGPTM